MSEKIVSIAARLYECRRTALSLLGPEKLKAKVEDWRPIIEAAMKKHNVDVIKAGMEVAKVLNADGDNGMGTMIVMAVCVEMVEAIQ